LTTSRRSPTTPSGSCSDVHRPPNRAHEPTNPTVVGGLWSGRTTQGDAPGKTNPTTLHPPRREKRTHRSDLAVSERLRSLGKTHRRVPGGSGQSRTGPDVPPPRGSGRKQKPNAPARHR